MVGDFVWVVVKEIQWYVEYCGDFVVVGLVFDEVGNEGDIGSDFDVML